MSWDPKRHVSGCVGIQKDTCPDIMRFGVAFQGIWNDTCQDVMEPRMTSVRMSGNPERHVSGCHRTRNDTCQNALGFGTARVGISRDLERHLNSIKRNPS
eukprot:1076092-Amorphochlora_amoeboformis.AAC.1